MKRLTLLLLSLVVLGLRPCSAQGDSIVRTHEPCAPTSLDFQPECRPIHSTYAVEVGGGMIADTYLSPLRYHGVHLALTGDWTKALPWHRGMSMSFQARIEGMRLQNPAGNATEWQGAVAFDWLVRRGWHVTDRLTDRKSVV